LKLLFDDGNQYVSRHGAPDLRNYLRDVLVQHYAQAGRSTKERGYPNRQYSELLQGFEIDEEEVSDLIKFLKSLTDQTFITNPRHSNPWTP